MSDTRQMTAEELQMLAYVRSIMTTTLRGMMASNPKVPSEMFLVHASIVLAQLIGEMYVGDELNVYKFRKMCRDAFNDFLKAVPIQPLNIEAAPETAALNR